MPNPLEGALLGADGHTPTKITRVEIELLDGGRFRWTLWSEARRLQTLTGGAADCAPMIDATSKIIETELAARQGAN